MQYVNIPARPAAIIKLTHYLRAPFVGADRRQVPACAYTLGQSLLARHALCDTARSDDEGGARRQVGHRLTFDFHDHALIGETADMRESFPLDAMSVADFLSRTTTLVERLGGRMDIHGTPNEIPNAKSAADNEVARKRTVAGSREVVFACLHMANPRLVCRIGYGFGAISPRGRQPQKS